MARKGHSYRDLFTYLSPEGLPLFLCFLRSWGENVEKSSGPAHESTFFKTCRGKAPFAPFLTDAGTKSSQLRKCLFLHPHSAHFAPVSLTNRLHSVILEHDVVYCSAFGESGSRESASRNKSTSSPRFLSSNQAHMGREVHNEL